MLNIITLMENRPSEHKTLIYKHGLSFLIRCGNLRLLFDCGPDETHLVNAHRLGIDLRQVDAVALSHAHYDHAAGFRDFVEAGNHCGKLFIGKDFFEAKYAAENAEHYTNLSCGFDENFLAENGISYEICSDCTKLAEGIYLVSGFERTHPFETIPERFVRKTAGGFLRDDFHDEICLVIETKKGLVVIVGCSHPGILNMTSSIHRRFQKPIYAVFGGTHLVEADAGRIESSLKEMKEEGVRLFGLCHCSGEEAEGLIAAHTELAGCHLAVGDEVYID